MSKALELSFCYTFIEETFEKLKFLHKKSLEAAAFADPLKAHNKYKSKIAKRQEKFWILAGKQEKAIEAANCVIANPAGEKQSIN